MYRFYRYRKWERLHRLVKKGRGGGGREKARGSTLRLECGLEELGGVLFETFIF